MTTLHLLTLLDACQCLSCEPRPEPIHTIPLVTGPLVDPMHQRALQTQLYTITGCQFCQCNRLHRRLGGWMSLRQVESGVVICERRLSFQQLPKRTLGSLRLHISPIAIWYPHFCCLSLEVTPQVASLVLSLSIDQKFPRLLSVSNSTMDILIAQSCPLVVGPAFWSILRVFREVLADGNLTRVPMSDWAFMFWRSLV